MLPVNIENKNPIMNKNTPPQSSRSDLLYSVGEALYRIINKKSGLFVEIGSGDGLEHSKTLYLEKSGWQGILIEAEIEKCGQCMINRPISVVLNYQCSIDDNPKTQIQHNNYAQNNTAPPVRGPHKALSSIFKELEINHIDLLVLNANVNYIDALGGLNLSLHFTPYILIENSSTNNASSYLLNSGYEPIQSIPDFTSSFVLYYSDRQHSTDQAYLADITVNTGNRYLRTPDSGNTETITNKAYHIAESETISFEQAKDLHEKGEIEESLRLALKVAESNPWDTEIQRQVASFIISNNYFHLFGNAVDILKGIISDFDHDINVHNAFSYACWVTGYKNECFQSSLRMIALDPKFEAGYKRLGMFLLTENRYTEGFIAICSGINNCENRGPIEFWHTLAQFLMQGIKTVVFNIDGMDFSFWLSSFNGQALETSAYYTQGLLTELEELRFIREELGRCRTVVDCGILLGNHLVYFMKVLQADKIFAFDADMRSINESKKNVELNQTIGVQSQVIFHHKAVGKLNGTTRMFDKDIDVVALSDVINEPIDFIKIDVDGMEMDAIQGARDLILRSKPKIMIEVENRQLDTFLNFMNELGYVVKKRFKRHSDSNLFLVPSS